MYSCTIGSLVGDERKKKKVPLRVLAKGVCAFQMLSKIEDNQCDVDKLLVDILLQRLGKSPDKLECILSSEEYTRIRARDMIEELILKGKVSKAEYLLGRYIRNVKDNDYVQQMYYHRTKAYIAVRCTQDYGTAREHIVKAINITLPGWENNSFGEYMISTYEMENMLMYGKVLYLLGENEAAMLHLDRCYEYISVHFTDVEEKSKILPKCVYLMSVASGDVGDDLRLIGLCEEGLSLLREQAIIHFMLPLIREAIRRYEMLGVSKKVEYWQRFKELLEWLYDNYAPDVCYDSLFMNCHREEYHLDYEIIRAERVGQGITQEELIEGIYQYPVSLSNLENAKSSPTKRNFESLMERLGVNKKRYNTIAIVESFEVLEIIAEFNSALNKRELEYAGRIKNILNERLILSIEENYILMETMRIILDYRLGNIDAYKMRQASTELLAKTYNVNKDEFVRVPMYNELMLLNRICISLSKDECWIEAIDISEKLMKLYKNSKVDCSHHYRTYNLIRSNLAIYCEKEMRIEAAISQSEEGISYELKCGKGSALKTYLIRLAVGGAYETQHEQISMFRRGYDISELFLQKHGMGEAEYYCKKVCNVNFI